MAKLPQLIEKFAKFDPRGESGVENMTRELRKHGLISTGKRGLGAPHMVASDLTNMLFGMPTRQAKEAPEAILKLRNATIGGPSKGPKEPIAFMDKLHFFNSTIDDDRHVKAGLFVDGIINEIMTFGWVRKIGSEIPFISVELEVLDPISGFGCVRVVFNRSMKDEFHLAFNEYSSSRTDGIQLAAIVGSEVLFILAKVLAPEDEGE